MNRRTWTSLPLKNLHLYDKLSFPHYLRRTLLKSHTWSHFPVSQLVIGLKMSGAHSRLCGMQISVLIKWVYVFSDFPCKQGQLSFNWIYTTSLFYRSFPTSNHVFLTWTMSWKQVLHSCSHTRKVEVGTDWFSALPQHAEWLSWHFIFSASASRGAGFHTEILDVIFVRVITHSLCKDFLNSTVFSFPKHICVSFKIPFLHFQPSWMCCLPADLSSLTRSNVPEQCEQLALNPSSWII